MATKSMTIIRPGRYGTRMLKAGDPLEVTAPEARLYSKLGWATEGPQQPAKRPPPKRAPAKRKRKAKAKK